MKSKKVEFQVEVELEVQCSVTPEVKGRRAHKFDPPDPDEPSEVEDLYVGVIIRGTAIDITSLLNEKQREWIEEECFATAKDQDRE
jgi:hypothetical protein